MQVRQQRYSVKRRLLCLAPQEPWPVSDGGKEGIHGAVQALAAHWDILLLCPAGACHKDAVQHFARLGVVYRTVDFKPVESFSVVLSATMRLKPYKFYKYCTAEAERLFGEAIGTFEPDAIVCFHAHMEELGQRVRRHRGWVVPIAVREHNIEYEMVSSYVRSRHFLQRLVGTPIAWLTKRAETRMWDRTEVTAFLTSRDLEVGRSSGSQGHLILAPEGVPLPPRRNAVVPIGTPSLLIPLNPNAPQSVASLKIFLDRYWCPSVEDLSKHSFELVITGASPSELARVVQMTEHEQRELRVRAAGFLPSLQPLFSSSLLLIAPSFVGSGVRKKVLEGMANQIPVMGTELDFKACSYLEKGHNILELSTVEDFQRTVISLKSDPVLWQKLSDNGRNTVEKYANWKQFAIAMTDGLLNFKPKTH